MVNKQKKNYSASYVIKQIQSEENFTFRLLKSSKSEYKLVGKAMGKRIKFYSFGKLSLVCKAT